MRGKTAKKLRRFALAGKAMMPNKSLNEIYDELKIVHKNKTNPQKYATYKKVSAAQKEISKTKGQTP